MVTSSGSNVTPGLDGTTRGLPLTSFTVASTGLPLPLVAPLTRSVSRSASTVGTSSPLCGCIASASAYSRGREPHAGLVEDQGHRAGHRRVGERVQGLADVGLVDLRLHVAELEVDGGLLVEVRRDDGVGGRHRVDALADRGVPGGHARVGEPDRSVARRGADVGAEIASAPLGGRRRPPRPRRRDRRRRCSSPRGGAGPRSARLRRRRPRRRSRRTARSPRGPATPGRPPWTVTSMGAAARSARLLLEASLRIGLAEPADVDTRDRGAARDLVTGGERGGRVPAGHQQGQDEDQHEHEAAAGALAGLARPPTDPAWSRRHPRKQKAVTSDDAAVPAAG